MLASAARGLSAKGLIDDVRHLKRARIYTHCGEGDGSMGATRASYEFFAEFTAANNLLGKFDLPAGHCWPGDTGIMPCRVVLRNFWPAENW